MIPKRSVVVVLVAVVCFVALSAFKAHQSPTGQAILFLLTPAYVGALVLALIEPIRGWRTYGIRTAIPLVACVSAWYGAYPVGAFFQSHLFISNLPHFQAIVSGIRSESLPDNGETKLIEIGKADRGTIQYIFAHKANDGAVVVEIDTENGFPMKHSGYVYTSSGVFPKDPKFHYRWPYVDQFNQIGFVYPTENQSLPLKAR